MIRDKIFLIVGGDLRQVYLAERLYDKGNRVYVCGIEKEFEISKEIRFIDRIEEVEERIDYVVLPIPASIDDKVVNSNKVRIGITDILEKLDDKAIVFGGKISKDIKILSKIYNVEIIDYLDREELSVLNAVPTAEGAIQITMEEIAKTIYGLRCLITGYGRISKVLSKILVSMGADVSIGARKSSDIAWGKIYGAKGIKLRDIGDKIDKFDVIYNTIPAKILDENILSKVDKKTLVIDLASKPGGVEFEVANKLGIKTIWALSLPGKVAPITSGDIIYETINNILEERGIKNE